MLDKACEPGVIAVDPSSFSNTASVNMDREHRARGQIAGSAIADVDTLTVTLETNVTTIDLLAQLRSEFNLGGEYQIDADLRVEGRSRARRSLRRRRTS